MSSGFHHRGSTWIGDWFHNTHPYEYINNVFHTCNPSEYNQQTPQNIGPTAFEGNLLALVMVEQTILQAALASIEMFNGTKPRLKLGEKLSKCGTNFRSKCNTCSFF